MGYSCSALASLTMDGMFAEMEKTCPPADKTSNGWIFKGNSYFFERGREQDDGAITGSVYRHGDNNNGIAKGFCRRVGSVKILSNGQIKSWPFTTKGMREKAQAAGRKRFAEIHGEEETQRQIAIAS